MSEETQLSQLGDLTVGRARKQKGRGGEGGKPDISLFALFILHQRDTSSLGEELNKLYDLAGAAL